MNRLLGLAMVFQLCLGLSCSREEPDSSDTPKLPVADQQVFKSSRQITPAVYWANQIERQRAMRDYLKNYLRVYKMYGGATQEAMPELIFLECIGKQKIQELRIRQGIQDNSQHMVSPLPQALQEEMQEHPEVRDEFMHLSMEMRNLKDQVIANTSFRGTGEYSKDNLRNNPSPTSCFQLLKNKYLFQLARLREQVEYKEKMLEFYRRAGGATKEAKEKWLKMELARQSIAAQERLEQGTKPENDQFPGWEHYCPPVAPVELPLDPAAISEYAKLTDRLREIENQIQRMETPD